jgi:hypothetical protein
MIVKTDDANNEPCPAAHREQQHDENDRALPRLDEAVRGFNHRRG